MPRTGAHAYPFGQEGYALATEENRVIELAARSPPSLSLEKQLHLAIDTIPGLVWTAQPDGHIDFLNQRWLEYTGLTLEQASGWGWGDAVHPEDLPGLVVYWRSVLAAGMPGETEARLRRFDGEYRWFLFRGVPLYDEEGHLVKWYGQVTDELLSTLVYGARVKRLSC